MQRDCNGSMAATSKAHTIQLNGTKAASHACEHCGWDISEGTRKQLTYVFFCAPGYGRPMYSVGEKAVTAQQPGTNITAIYVYTRLT